MATIAGSGRSTHVDSRAAAAEAVRMAQAPLGDARPGFGLIFASPKHDLGAALAAAEAPPARPSSAARPRARSRRRG